jgi:hypothetical protein
VQGDQTSLSCQKDGRLNKNSDLTLDIEKPTIEKSSASSTDLIVPNNEHVANNLAEQQSCSAGGGNMIIKWSVLKAPV